MPANPYGKQLMRIGLFSDIHGNIFALEAVLAELEREPVDQILCAGDFVGYYPFVNNVIDRLKTINMRAVLGNHDRYLLAPGMISAEKWEAYRLEDAARSMHPDKLNWLRQLPLRQELTFDGLRVILCHGSPWATDEYIYPDFGQWERFAELDADVIVMGHTHIPFEKRDGQMQFINPGSVGQPRDYQPGACYAILETRTREVMFRRKPYDIHHLIHILQSRDFPPSLIQILIREKHHE